MMRSRRTRGHIRWRYWFGRSSSKKSTAGTTPRSTTTVCPERSGLVCPRYDPRAGPVEVDPPLPDRQALCPGDPLDTPEHHQILIARARQNGELDGPVFAAIDVTKGFPFTGDTEDHKDDILGHRDGNQYYQWAVRKIVGMDVPLVLDAMPRERGQSKHEIVEELLTHATEMVTLDLVMMDREFDSAGVKETCEEYGVHYLNLTRIFERSEEADTIAWMYRNGKRFHVEKETDDDTPTRKQLYLPKQSNSGDYDEDDGHSDVWNEMCGEWVFEDVEGEPLSVFHRVFIAEMFAPVALITCRSFDRKQTERRHGTPIAEPTYGYPISPRNPTIMRVIRRNNPVIPINQRIAVSLRRSTRSPFGAGESSSRSISN